MSKPSKRIRIMIPWFWILFTRYLNNPNYFVKSDDVLSKIFKRGEVDVKTFIHQCNKHSNKNGLDVYFTYKPNLTYNNLLKQLNNEQIEIY